MRTSTNASSAARKMSHPMKAFNLAPSFCCILLGIRSELVEQSVLHGTIVNHDVRGRRNDVLDGSLKICDDGLRQESIVC